VRYLAAIVLDGFYASAASRKAEGPLVVHRGRKVIDACSTARSRGVAPPMALTEARSILAADGQFVEWEEELFRGAQRRWLRIVSEFSDVIEPLSQHEALADLSGHPRPREAAAQMERALRERLGLSPKVGLAACRWVSRLAARRGDPLGLAHADPASYVSGVSVAQLPIDPAFARHLDLLGYRTAADVAELSPEILLGQFGTEGPWIAHAALGKGESNVKALFPEGAASCRFVFDGVPETREVLDAGLRRLAREIGTELRNSDRAGRTVELFLEAEDASVERRVRQFARSLTCENDVFNALGLMLPEPPAQRIESVRARLPEFQSARRVQLDIQGGRSRADIAEGVRIAIQHVRGTFGDKAVRLASEIPEPRWVKVRRAYMEANGFCWT
jgi:nucleotidyltransferase/DNA polymerase involved in DNA repair